MPRDGLTLKVEMDHLTNLGNAVRKRAGQVVRQTALNIAADAKDSMAEPKSGRIYDRPGKAHQASAPGESPAIDYGVLVNSVADNVISQTEAEVAVGAEYADELELGTSKIAPRPFLAPAVEANAQAFEQAIQQVIEQAAGSGR